MGGVVRKAKKIVKKVTKPITKIVKKTVKKVKKIGKAVMKGVSKISNKLGPVGMIALSIAMPYALTGLSNFTNFAQAYSGVGQTFLNAVGTVGNQIRLGYQAFNTGMSIAKKSITDVIGKTFQKFAPKGGTNIFSRISDGAKRLYTAAKEKLRKYGIAPPECKRTDKNAVLGAPKTVSCPRCQSISTNLVSPFGSTACKAMYTCKDCFEPFEYFKCL